MVRVETRNILSIQNNGIGIGIMIGRPHFTETNHVMK